MKKKKLSSGIRKFIREEKSRIRKEVIDVGEQKKEIEALVDGFKIEEKA